MRPVIANATGDRTHTFARDLRTLQPHNLRNAKHCSSLKLNIIRQSSRRDSLRDTLLLISLTRNEFDDGVIVHEILYDDTNERHSHPNRRHLEERSTKSRALSTQDSIPTINQNTSRTNMCAVMHARRDINGCIQITTN